MKNYFNWWNKAKKEAVDASDVLFRIPVSAVKGGVWKKVSELKEGQLMATIDANGEPMYERIVSIEPAAEEDVYDIEVEGTHNFIGNDIVAHNTAIFNQASTTQLSVTNKAYFGGTATSTFDSAGALTLITPLLVESGGTGQKTFASSQLLYGAGTGAVQSVATSSLALSTGLNLSAGSLGYQIGGTNATIKLADTAVTLGSYGSSTAIPTFTVDQQGRLTAASTAAVIAPAGTLTGTALASNVVSSSLTSVGLLANASTTQLSISGASWLGTPSALVLTNATGLPVAGGGTGAATLTGLLQGNGTSAITGITGTAGQFPYYNGTNTLLATSSLFLATNSFVGIGTTTPLSKLAVSGGASVGADYNIAAPTNGLIIQGNVGIGTTGPESSLDVFSSAPTISLFGNADDTIQTLRLAENGHAHWRGGFLKYDGATNILNLGVHDASNKLTSSDTNVISIARSSGNVGIGTTTPGAVLDVVGGIYNTGIRISNSNVAGAGVSLVNSDTGGKQWSVISTGSANAGGAGNLGFYEESQDYRLYLKSGGNVGIGTTSPVSKLSVLGESAFAGGASVGIGYAGTAAPTGGMIIQGNVGIGTTSPATLLDVNGLTTLSGTPTQSQGIPHLYLKGATTGPQLLRMDNNSGTNALVLGLEQSTGGALATGSTGYAAILGSVSNVPLQLITNNAVQMTILGSGNVGIGTTSPATLLEVGGSTANVTFDGYKSCTGFTSDGNGKLACTASDQRLKNNIQAMSASSSLAALRSLAPVSFYWRDASPSGLEQYGFIAQDVVNVFPNLVQTTNPTELTPGGTMTVNYIGLIAPMIGAIQALDAKLGPLAGVLSVVPGVESQCVTGDTKLRRRRRKKGVATLADGDPCISEDSNSLGLSTSPSIANGIPVSSTSNDHDDAYVYDEIEIKNVVAGDEVQSLDEASGQVVYSRVNALVDMGEQEVYELVTKSGRRIRTTANHPFLARMAPKKV